MNTSTSTRSNTPVGGLGRILYLTEDAKLLEEQLSGKSLTFDAARPLVSNISTDEITPGWVC
jgi:3-isopropylmalate/(R)-2-methylmalate dehydratase large subunit